MKRTNVGERINRDTITYVDTIAYYKPVAKDSVAVRYVTRVLRVAGHEVPPTSPVGHQTGGTAQGGSLPRTTVAYMKADGLADGNDGVNESNGLNGSNGLDGLNGCDGGDTFLLPDYAQIPDENIRVGFSSDSIPVEIPIIQKRYEGDDYRAYVSGYEPSLDSIYVFPKTTVIHERSYKPPNKWHIGITGGCGYGFKSKQAEPYIGIGITYSIFSF
ncbi:MAG: hypothetical protein IJ607_01150 [Bacteroidaceae bacterium]|nr:hypothetical protein [Bacteroidaceae bacterium]